MNWESEENMAEDVEENPELYKALADGRGAKPDADTQSIPRSVQSDSPQDTPDLLQAARTLYEMEMQCRAVNGPVTEAEDLKKARKIIEREIND